MRKLYPLVWSNLLCIAALMAFLVIVGPLIRLLNLEEWHGGLMVAVVGLTWMLLARSWGHASDRHGRKPVLLIALGGFALSYLALALFLEYAIGASLSVLAVVIALTLLRATIGAFYAAVPVSGNALIADTLESDKRTSAMAMLGASNAVGMIIGPLLAGLLVTFGLIAPVYFATVLPVIAFIVLWVKLPHIPVDHDTDLPKLKLSDARIRLPVWSALLAMNSVIAAQILVGFFAIDRLQLDLTMAAQVSGYAMTAVGVTLVLVQGTIMKKSHLKPDILLRLGAIVAAAGFGLVSFSFNTTMLIAGYSLAAAGLGMVFPGLQAMTANAVEPHEQGAAAGSVSAAQGLAMVISPVIATLLYKADPSLPYWFVSAALLVLSIYAHRYLKNVATPPGSEKQLSYE